jgi:hypothetical protein
MIVVADGDEEEQKPTRPCKYCLRKMRAQPPQGSMIEYLCGRDDCTAPPNDRPYREIRMAT